MSIDSDSVTDGSLLVDESQSERLQIFDDKQTIV